MAIAYEKIGRRIELIRPVAIRRQMIDRSPYFENLTVQSVPAMRIDLDVINARFRDAQGLGDVDAGVIGAHQDAMVFA